MHVWFVSFSQVFWVNQKINRRLMVDCRPRLIGLIPAILFIYGGREAGEDTIEQKCVFWTFLSNTVPKQDNQLLLSASNAQQEKVTVWLEQWIKLSRVCRTRSTMGFLFWQGALLHQFAIQWLLRFLLYFKGQRQCGTGIGHLVEELRERWINASEEQWNKVPQNHALLSAHLVLYKKVEYCIHEESKIEKGTTMKGDDWIESCSKESGIYLSSTTLFVLEDQSTHWSSSSSWYVRQIWMISFTKPEPETQEDEKINFKGGHLIRWKPKRRGHRYKGTRWCICRQ